MSPNICPAARSVACRKGSSVTRAAGYAPVHRRRVRGAASSGRWRDACGQLTGRLRAGALADGPLIILAARLFS